MKDGRFHKEPGDEPAPPPGRDELITSSAQAADLRYLPPLPPRARPGSCLVRLAEDARFELARACTQHAFQVCGRALCWFVTICRQGKRGRAGVGERR